MHPNLPPLRPDPSAPAEITTESDMETSLSRLRSAQTKNTYLRRRHALSPGLFLQSELQLHAALHAISSVAVLPDLYHPFISQGGLDLLTKLLAHENEDLVCAVVGILNDIAVGIDEDEVRNLIHEEILERGVLEGLVAVLGRLARGSGNGDVEDEKVRAEGVAKGLGIFEDLLDGTERTGAQLVEKTGILEACVAMIGLDHPVEEAAELLAILMQERGRVLEVFLDMGGMEGVLNGVERLKGGVEVVENLFAIICSVVLEKRGRAVFVDEKGVEILLGVMKRSRKYRWGALRVLDFGCVGNEGAVRRVFEGGGLGVLGVVLGNLEGEWREGEMRGVGEHLFGVLFSMLRYGGESEVGRLVRKMREGGKVWGVVRVFIWFKDGDFEGGDLVVRMGAVILGYVLAYGDEGMRKAVSSALEEIEIRLEEILMLGEEYVEGIDDGEEKEGEKKRIERLAQDIKNKFEGLVTGD